MRVSPETVLSNEEYAELSKLVRSKRSSVRLAHRAAGRRWDTGQGHRPTVGRTRTMAVELGVSTASVSRDPQFGLEGYPVKPEDEARLSPFGHEHINMLGRYSFSVPEAVARGELRPLNGGREES